MASMASSGTLQEPFTIILPTLNEAENITALLDALFSTYPMAQVLVLDDNSTDGTVAQVQSIASSGRAVHVVVRDPKDKGLTASVIEGISMVDTSRFVVMDADFQHPVEAVTDLLGPLAKDADITVGVRGKDQSLSLSRRLASSGADLMARAYLRYKRRARTRDVMSGFFAARTKIVQEIIRNNGGRFEREGFKVLFDILKFLPSEARLVDVQYHFRSRRGGESKLSSKVVLSIMRQCGIWGRGMAALTSFLLLNTLGRYVAALLLGVLLTYGVLFLTNTTIDSEMTSSVSLALLLSVGYLVLMNQWVYTTGRREGLVRGLKLVFTGLTGYLIALYVFHQAFTDVTGTQMLALFSGFALGCAWDVLGHVMRK